MIMSFRSAFPFSSSLRQASVSPLPTMPSTMSASVTRLLAFGGLPLIRFPRVRRRDVDIKPIRDAQRLKLKRRQLIRRSSVCEDTHVVPLFRF